MDQSSFEFVQNEHPKLNRNEANIVSSVNRALHREGISDVRVERIQCTDSRRLLGVTTPTSTLQDLLRYRDTALKAARLANSCIADLVPQQKWKWVRIHGISLTQYMGGARDGGLRKLREELEAENSGVHIPAEIRWLGGAKVRARFQADKDGSSSVVAAVLGEETFGRLCKSRVRLFGRRYEVDAFEEAWKPDAFCSQCSEWKHIAPHYLAAGPRCALCARDHLTTDHQCPVQGCRAEKGQSVWGAVLLSFLLFVFFCFLVDMGRRSHWETPTVMLLLGVRPGVGNWHTFKSPPLPLGAAAKPLP